MFQYFKNPLLLFQTMEPSTADLPLRPHLIILTLALVVLVANGQQTPQQKKARIQREEVTIRDNVDLKYGQNTETLTFAVSHNMVDFVVKPTQKEEIKGTLFTYWKDGNIYVSSQYREGQNMRVLIYEDNARIISDFKFYMAYGFKFEAEKGKSYIIRFIDEGSIGKLVAMEISKTSSVLEDRANKQQVEKFGSRLESFLHELKALTGVSELAIILHEKQAGAVNHSSCIYMTYLIAEAIIILAIVIVQVKVMLKMLKSNTIV